MIAWVFFRSESIESAFEYLILLFTKFSFPTHYRSRILIIIIFASLEWIFRKDERNPISFTNPAIRFCTYILLIYFVIADFKILDLKNFIYFQF